MQISPLITKHLQVKRRCGGPVDSDTSSMSGKIEYLEKYSVAPSPSRDYYGLKVLRDQVILYLWKISHGPHKSPVIRTSCFADFEHDKPLQDEIRRGFGEYLLTHVSNIASGQRNSLLTLPKTAIEKLVKYLTVNDIIKLSSLSRVAREVFNDNFVWETLYKQKKPLTKTKYENLYATNNWKQMYQQMLFQGLVNEQKMSRNRVSMKQPKTNMKLEDPAKPFNSISKAMPKLNLSVNQAAKKSSENIHKKVAQNAVSKKLSDSRLDGSTSKKEKIGMEKIPTIKSIQTIGQRNMKTMRERSMVMKNESKREIESKESLIDNPIETKSEKTHSKVRKTDLKLNHTSSKTAIEKPSSVKIRSGPTVTKNEKPAQRLAQGGNNKPKTKTKMKKIGQSKSTILHTDADIVGVPSPIRDDSFNLADLIEASLKNMRSPRSIFSDNFSCLKKYKPHVTDINVQQDFRGSLEQLKGYKSSGLRATLDRLSEKSEPSTAKSKSSVNKTDLSCGTIAAQYATSEEAKTNKSTKQNKCGYTAGAIEEKMNNFERYKMFDKYPTPRANNNVEQKRTISQNVMDKMDLLRSLGSSNLCGYTVSNSRGIQTGNGGFHDKKKTISHVRKDQQHKSIH